MMRARVLLSGLLAFAYCCRSGGGETADEIHDVPRIGDVRIDGTAEDWGDRGLRIEAFHYADGLVDGRNFWVEARLGWQEAGLYLLVEVTDDVAREEARESDLWRGDSIELFLAAGVGDPNYFQVLVAPGTDPRHGGQPRYYVNDPRRDREQRPPVTVDLAVAKHVGGYCLECRLPWQNLGIEAREGRELGLQLYVNDDDSGRERRQARWFPAGGTHADSRRMHRIRLAAQPGPPVLLAATARYEHLRLLCVEVAAAAALAGKDVSLVGDTGLLARGRLAARGPGASTALSAPMPPRGKPYGTLGVLVPDTPETTVTPPDADAERRRAFEQAELRLTPVFAGRDLPDVDLKYRGWIETLVGPCTVTARWFDAEYRDVTEARTPGRYGVIVDIETADGWQRREFLTHFRLKAGVGWRQWRQTPWEHFDNPMPDGLGLPPELVRRQQKSLAEFLQWRFVEALETETGAAALLAALHETAADAPPGLQRNGPRNRDARWWYGLRKKLGLVNTRYLLDLPAAYEQDKAKRWPLLLFLHGAGERGDNLEAVRTHGPPKQVAAGRDLPFIVVSPQCPAGSWWLPAELADLLDSVMATYRVDPDRVYVTGLSMGGFGTWALAAEYPERFAAIVPICGGGDPAEVPRICQIPTWVFHGADDGVVPPSFSEDMVKALRASGAHPGFTVYPGVGHDSWKAAYADRRLYPWLLANRRGAPTVDPPDSGQP